MPTHILRQMLSAAACLVLAGLAHAAEPVAVLGEAKVEADDIRAAVIGLQPDLVSRIAESDISARTLVRELITRRLLAQKALEERLDQDPVVQARIEQARERVLYEALMARADASIAEDAIAALAHDEYRANRNRFSTPERVRARHILIAGGDNIESARAQAEAIRARLLAGEDFAELAETLSADRGSARRGGDLGAFARGRMVPEFDAVAFSLAPNEVSEPTKTEFGYHLIKVEETLPAGVMSFDEVRESLEARVRQKLRTNARSQIVEPIRNDPGLRVDLPAVQAIARDAVPGPVVD